jgi:hypothetical protein
MHAGGRPKKTDGFAEWLRAYVADGPKPSQEIIDTAEREFSVCEKTTNREWRKLKFELNRELPPAEQVRDEYGVIGPWRSFQRNSRWFWGDERKMPRLDPEDKLCPLWMSSVQFLRGDIRSKKITIEQVYDSMQNDKRVEMKKYIPLIKALYKMLEDEQRSQKQDEDYQPVEQPQSEDPFA